MSGHLEPGTIVRSSDELGAFGRPDVEHASRWVGTVVTGKLGVVVGPHPTGGHDGTLEEWDVVRFDVDTDPSPLYAVVHPEVHVLPVEAYVITRVDLNITPYGEPLFAGRSAELVRAKTPWRIVVPRSTTELERTLGLGAFKVLHAELPERAAERDGNGNVPGLGPRMDVPR